MGGDGVRARPAEVSRAQSLQDLVGQAAAAASASWRVPASVTPEPSRSEGSETFFPARAWICAESAVDQDDADVERPQDGDVREDVAEVVVVHEGAVGGDHERLFPETGAGLQELPRPMAHPLIAGTGCLLRALTQRPDRAGLTIRQTSACLRLRPAGDCAGR